MVTFNQLTTDDDLNQEYLDALQKRDIPSKFSFIGNIQAKTWIDICNGVDYKNYEESMGFIDSVKEEIASFIKSDINLIALGSSGMDKPKILLQEILKNQKANFFAIDQSIQIAKNTISRMEDIDTPKEVFIAPLNFTHMRQISSQIRRNSHQSHLFVILSNTFGVRPQECICKALREGMNNSDYLLIGVHIAPERIDPKYIQDTLQRYTNPDVKKRTMASLLWANITQDDGIVQMEYNTDRYSLDLSRVSEYFKFMKSKVVSFAGEDIYFAKNERIRIRYSNKYTVSGLRQILNNHGFSIKKEFLSQDGRYMKVLCKLA